MLEILVEVIRLDTNGQPNYAGDLLYRLSMHAEKQLHANPALAFKFLVAVYAVFDDRELRKSELATKLQHAFWRGLAFPHDRNLRHQFYRIFESQFPEHLFDRLLYALTEQHWTPLQSHFWIPLALNLLMRAAVGAKAAINAADGAADKSTTNARLQLTNCASFARTSERLFDASTWRRSRTRRTTPAGCTWTAAGATDRRLAQRQFGPQIGDLRPRTRRLCDLINNTRLEDVVRNVAELAYSDARLARALFVRFFASVWNQMPEATVKRRTTIARFFLVTGELSAADELPITPLNCFYEAFARSTHPIPVDPSTLEYIATHHNGWYAVIDRIERQLRRAPRTLGS
ncbi:FAT domain-containing protein [Aphelenchoides fujianensis]|nr:FAT domain-containing protein [Aphelenchoides fujianensis]